MNQWICEDVGLVLEELKAKLEKETTLYLDAANHKEDAKLEGIIQGLDIAGDILEEVADNWTSEDPPAEILNKLKSKYGDDLI